MANFGNISLGSDPFVGISDEIVLWGGKRCAIKRIIIGGKIYGCGSGPNTGNDILNVISSWQDTALNGYQSINVGGFSSDYARCESLEITNSDYLGAEYRAEFLAYPEEWFKDIVGVLEPVDNIVVSIGKDGLYTVKRNVSARASNDKGLEAVFNWLESLNLKEPPSTSSFGFPNITSRPKTFVQTIDRINGVISAEITFIQNEGSSANSILSYSIEIQYDDKEGIYNVTISGSLEGNTETNINEIRNQIDQIGVFQLAEDAYSKFNGPPLDPTPSNFNFSENDETDTVNFSFTYNTFPIGGQKKYFNFTIDYDHIKDIVTVTISGSITFDSKISLKNRENLIENIIQQYDFRGLCSQEFNKNSPSQNAPLNLNNPTSYSITIKRGSDVSADVSVSFSNEDILPSGAENFISFDYDIQITPSSNILIPAQFIDGGGGIFDFQAKNRGNISIRGTAISKNSGIESTVLNIAENLLNETMGNFGPQDEIVLEKNVIFDDTSDNGIRYEFEIKKGAILNIN
jgi:hypothetical protein